MGCLLFREGVGKHFERHIGYFLIVTPSSGREISLDFAPLSTAYRPASEKTFGTTDFICTFSE
jgi:hypothetical protein